MEKLIKIFVALFSCGISGKEIPKEIKDMITPELYGKIYRVSQMHGVSHIIGATLSDNGVELIDTGVAEKYVYSMQKAVYTYLQQETELESITAAFENAGISFIPLKGAVLKKLYPQPEKRTSCDIDILVKPDELDAAIKCLEEACGYVCRKKASHEVVFDTPSGENIELHFNLIEQGRVNASDKVLENVWYDAELQNGYKYCFKMSNEMFYFYHIAHMVKHFLEGGCGVKSVADLWIMKKYMAFDNAKRDGLLEKGGLLKFAKESEKLAEVWFGDGKYTEALSKMEKFIVTGGSYGSAENQVAVKQAKAGGKSSIISKVFLSYDVIKYQYPILQKHKWLLPFYEVKRWFRLVFVPEERKRSMTHLAINNNLSEESRNSAKSLIEYLGII